LLVLVLVSQVSSVVLMPVLVLVSRVQSVVPMLASARLGLTWE
jgi:hypothetical protein